jgi:hypothetical protein
VLWVGQVAVQDRLHAHSKKHNSKDSSRSADKKLTAGGDRCSGLARLRCKIACKHTDTKEQSAQKTTTRVLLVTDAAGCWVQVFLQALLINHTPSAAAAAAVSKQTHLEHLSDVLCSKRRPACEHLVAHHTRAPHVNFAAVAGPQRSLRC